MHELKAKGVALKATGQPAGTAAGKAFFDMLGVFAEFDQSAPRAPTRGDHRRQGRGVYKGRQPSIDAAEVLRLHREEKLGPSAIARRLGIGRASVYRLIDKHGAAVAVNGGGDADQT